MPRRRWAAGAVLLPDGLCQPVAGAGGQREARRGQAGGPAGQCARGVLIWVSLHSKSLSLYKGAEVRRYAIATGTYETPTPIGVYRISHRFSGDLGALAPGF